MTRQHVAECCFYFTECAAMHNALFHISIIASSTQTSSIITNEKISPFFKAKHGLFQLYLHYPPCPASKIGSHIYFSHCYFFHFWKNHMALLYGNTEV